MRNPIFAKTGEYPEPQDETKLSIGGWAAVILAVVAMVALVLSVGSLCLIQLGA